MVKSPLFYFFKVHLNDKIWKKSDLKNAFDNKYLSKKILFGHIEMKPNVFSLDVCNLFKDWSLIYMEKKQEIILGINFFIFYH